MTYIIAIAVGAAIGWAIGAGTDGPRKLRTGVIRARDIIRLMREK